MKGLHRAGAVLVDIHDLNLVKFYYLRKTIIYIKRMVFIIIM